MMEFSAGMIPQNTYWGRVEIGGVYICPLSWSVHYNIVLDSRYCGRGWACTPHPHQAGLIFPARKWPLPFCLYSVDNTVGGEEKGWAEITFAFYLKGKGLETDTVKEGALVSDSGQARDMR
jgi:hypothetical protein